MNLTSWDLSYHTEAFVVIQTLIGGFLMGSIVVVKCIYKPWLEKLKLEEEEEEPEKYEDKYKFEEYYHDVDMNLDKDVKTKENNIVEDSTPDGNVFMKYIEEDEGFGYWCDNKNIKYDYLDTVARKYCMSFDCCGIYEDRKKNIEDQKSKEEEIKEKEEEIEEEEESIFIKSKKIDTKKNDRSKGEVALKANKFIYKGKFKECGVFLKKRDDELKNNQTNKKMSFLNWRQGCNRA